MERESKMPESTVMTCRHITSSDTEVIKGFENANPEGGFLASYLKQVAYDDEKNNMMRTYLVFDNISNELVAYFSLKSGFVSAEKKTIFHSDFDSIPGFEVANFAVNGKFIKNHSDMKGIGYYIFNKFIVPTARNAADIVGAKVLYIFALPHEKLIANYRKYGFSRLEPHQERLIHKRIRPRYDEDCIFMYLVL